MKVTILSRSFFISYFEVTIPQYCAYFTQLKNAVTIKSETESKHFLNNNSNSLEVIYYERSREIPERKPCAVPRHRGAGREGQVPPLHVRR